MEERAELSRGPTYEQARAELGGAPWREVPKSTDAWYILDDEAAALPAPTEPKRLRLAAIAAALLAAAAILFTVARPHAHASALPPDAIAAAPAIAATPSPSAAPAVATAAPSRPVAIAAPHKAAHARTHHKHDKHSRR